MGLKLSRAALISFVTHSSRASLIAPFLPLLISFLYRFRLNLSFSALTINSNMSSPYPEYGRPPRGENNLYNYPPDGASVPYSFNDSSTTIQGKYEFTTNRVSRTPSPTPSEAAELARDGVIDWKTMTNWRFWFRREWLCALNRLSFSVSQLRIPFPSSGYYVLGIVVSIVTLLLTVFHHQIVDKLTPVAHKIKE